MIELITVSLTSIWFVGGAVVALLADFLGATLAWQVILFFVVSIVLLCFTRPFAMKYINANHTKTNYEGVIGKNIRITETVNNIEQTGVATVNGLEWTVRSVDDAVILEAGTLAKVLNVSGVKLMVEEYKED